MEKREHVEQLQIKINSRESRVRECRNEFRHFNKQFKRATNIKLGIAVLTDDVRSELARLWKAEQLRKAKRTRIRNKARFAKIYSRSPRSCLVRNDQELYVVPKR
jgi:hypothetical protein